MSDELVLVTGGSGFVGAHCLVRLLKGGYRVRTTVRSLERESEVRAMVKAGGADPGETLTFAAADLTSDAGWPEAVAGCDRVLHVASPFPPGPPEHEDDLIVPARDGTLRVLRAAREAGVKRVVMTSSFAAIGYGHPPASQPFTEDTWTEPAGQSAYVKSKTLAERAAWDFIVREGGALQLAVINPTGIFGPVLGSDYSGSIGIVKALLDGAMPRVPRISFSVADVRDVAELHVRAMADPGAGGERFIVCSGDVVSLHQIALMLKARLPDHAQRVPAKVMPDWLLRLAARVNPREAAVAPDLGKVRRPSNAKARRVFGWEPRPEEETIVDTAESLIRFGLLAGGRRQAALYGIDMTSPSNLGDYLRARRQRLQPEDVGLPGGDRRRVPGLRREEVALLAGISAEYYLRLEQGRDRHPSDQVLGSIAKALRLEDDAETYLHTLARPARAEPRRSARAEQASRSVQDLIAGWATTPALVQGRYMLTLAANPMAVALCPLFAPGINTLRAAFCEPEMREFYRDWDEMTAKAVAYLRSVIGAAIDDPGLTELVGELSLRSERFRTLWARQDVRHKTSGLTQLRHPQVGPLDLHYEKFAIPASPGQVLVTYHADPGSPSQEKLQLLAHLAQT